MGSFQKLSGNGFRAPDASARSMAGRSSSVYTRGRSAAEMTRDLEKYRESVKARDLSVITPQALLRGIRKPKVAIPAAVCLLTLVSAGA